MLLGVTWYYRTTLPRVLVTPCCRSVRLKLEAGLLVTRLPVLILRILWNCWRQFSGLSLLLPNCGLFQMVFLRRRLNAILTRLCLLGGGQAVFDLASLRPGGATWMMA